MANVPKEKGQNIYQEHHQPGQRTRTSQHPTTNAYQQTRSQPIKNKTKTDLVDSIEKNRFTRPDLKRQSKKLATHQLETQKEQKEVSGNLQPSKIFAKKCLAEIRTLLEHIKTEYHSDIRSLLEDEAFVDLFIKVGDADVKIPLHKCIIASRAFKLYSALREFKTSNSSSEKDIIVAELQKSQPRIQDTAISSPDSANEKSRTSDREEPTPGSISTEKKEEQLKEALETFYCELPDNLLNIEYLSSFARRAYLDQDVSEDEIHLYLLVLNWLKVNKPDLIKTSPNRRSLDHRESFRTIQPDFDQLTISDSGLTMSTNEQSAIEAPRDIDDTAGDFSHASNSRSDNQPVSSLTRTDTFEMLSKAKPDPEMNESNKNNELALDEEDKEPSELSINTSEASELYTPVTRTGLKPKQFTPIVALKSSKTARTPCFSTKKTDSAEGDDLSKKAGEYASGGNQTGTASSTTPPVAPKRSSLTTGASPNSISSAANCYTPVSSKSRNASTKSTTPKVRQTVITRAHPISIERSQSPATNLSKGSTKNFIEANKKLISQIERKVATSSSNQGEDSSHANDDSDNEGSDVSLLAIIEQLCTNNLAAHLDKFALVSYSKLAAALSQMFIGGILTDIVVVTREGKEIDAHRCILAARSVYLSDQITKLCLPSMTPESPGSSKQLIKIDLSEFSYAAVYFALMHIYSGVVKVPEDLEIEELTKISHLLHVGTLRQVCIHNLKMNYCHYFHKPCSVCCIGVLKTLPLAWRYDLTELYSKCLQWIGAHFAQIFCLEEFSSLKPQDLIEECYNETLSQLTPDNVIQKTIECQKLLKSLPRVKWTEPVICLVGRQLEDFCHYVADNYEKILQSQSFLNLGKSCWECEVLEENLLAAMNHLKPDSGCKTLIQLDKIECSIETYCDEPRTVSETFANLISKMRKYCERYLLKDAAAVVHCSSWRAMNPSLQKKIKDQALIASDFDEPTRHLSNKPKLPSMSRHQQVSSSFKSSTSPQPTNSSGDSKSPSNRSTPDSRLKSPNTTYLPPPKTKPAVARHVKVLK